MLKCSSAGLDCIQDIPANYDHASNDANEKCDGSDGVKLCNLKLGRSDAPSGGYYDLTKVSCSSDCKSITTNDNACGFCGDGVWQSGKETCENTSEGINFSGGSFDKKSLTKTFTASDDYTVPISGIYEITVKGARGGHGFKTASSSGSGADGCGGVGAAGGVVVAQYYIEKGTTLTYTTGTVGEGATNGGNPRCDHRDRYGKSGGSGCSAGSSGGNGGHDTHWGDSYTAGGGGGGGGSSCIKIGNTVLLSAYGGGGGGGGGKGGNLSSSDGSDGGNGSGTSGGSGGSGGGSWGENGGNGGNGGGSNSHYSTTTGSDYRFISGSYSTSTNSGAGSITITLKKYAPCKSDCTFETSESNFIDVDKSISNCTGLPLNAQWNTVSSITQTWNDSSWTPTTTGSYNTTASTTECRYKCKSSYTWENSQCINQKVVDCPALGLPDSNAEWNTVDQITQNWNGSAWTPSDTVSYSETPSDSECRFKCKDGYTYYGGHCVNTRTVNCPTLPSGAVPNTASSITQNWTASGGWQPANTLAYSTTASTTYCRYKCNTNYTWNGSSCKADSHSANCTGLPSNASWNSVSSITQTWNGSSWTPSSAGTYNTTASTTACRFKCNSGYHWENNQCVSNTKTNVACTGLPATGATWNTASKITQTWNGSSWTPTTTGSYNTTASTTQCRFKCKEHYTWNSSTKQCVADQKSAACTGLPTNADWNTVSSITQTWNGSDWAPSSAGSYNKTGSTSECRFKCNSGYTWSNNQCKIDTYIWSFESDMPTSGNWIIQTGNNIRKWDTQAIESTSNAWVLTTDSPLGSNMPSPRGSKSLCSNIQGQNYKNAEFSVKLNVPSGGATMSFYYAGSTESGWDFLQVYVDPTSTDYAYAAHDCSNSDTEKLCTDGQTHSSWSKAEIPLSQGEHTILFRYHKDYSGSTSADKYCIDDLALSTCNADLGNALVYLKLNEGSGSTTANSGTLGGSYSVSSGSWNSSGKRGNAYNFTGSTIIGSAGTFIDSSAYYNNFTVMAWVKPTYTISIPSSASGSGIYTTTNNNERYIFGASHGGESPSTVAGAGVSVGTNGIFVTAHGGGYLPALAYYQTTLSSSEWNHVAVVFENKVPKIYLNGIHVATGATPSKTIFPPSQIGGGSYGNFYGGLDDVRIIGKALSDEEIKGEYQLTNSCSDL